MLLICTHCNGTGHQFNDEGQRIAVWGCQECDGLGQVEAEDCSVTQHDTNMSYENYLAYCNGWCACFDTSEVAIIVYDLAVKRGIVFG